MIEAKEYYETEESFAAYCDYIGIKNHFATAKYDYFKFNGKVTASVNSFRRRNDKQLFWRLSQMKTPKQRILAHVLHDIDASVRDMVEGDNIFFEWKKRQEAFFYHFKNDISKFENMRKAISVDDGNYPDIISEYFAGEVSLETITALDIAFEVMTFWKSRISETRLFTPLYWKVKKYRPFLELDKEKVKKTVNQ